MTTDKAKSVRIEPSSLNENVFYFLAQLFCAMILLLFLAAPTRAQTEESIYWVSDQILQLRKSDLQASSTADIVGTTNPAAHIAIDPVNKKIYWGEASSLRIRRSDFDGTNVETVVSQDSIFSIRDISFDTRNQKIYWATREAIYRANSDGSSFETVYAFSRYHIESIAVDSINGFIFFGARRWLDGDYIVARIRLEEGDALSILTTDVLCPGHIALDAYTKQVYYSNNCSLYTINSVSYDGTDETRVFTEVSHLDGLFLDAFAKVLYFVGATGDIYSYALADKQYKKVIDIDENVFFASVDLVLFSGADADSDGLNNQEEEGRRTDPFKSDTDNDGVSDGQEITDETDPLDASSLIPVLGTTVCAEWNGFLGGMWNILEHINLSSTQRDISTALYSIEGEKKGVVDFSVLPGAQQDVIVHDVEGWSLNSYGNVCSTIKSGNPGDLDGRMVYYKPSEDGAASGYQFAFAMPFLNGLSGTQYVPFNTFQPSLDLVDSENFVANWIQLTNLSQSAQRGVLTFVDISGLEIGNEFVSIDAGARKDFSAHQFGKNRVGFVRWIPDNSDEKFQLRNVRYLYNNDGSVNSFDTAFQLAGTKGSGNLLAMPLDTSEGSAIVEVSDITSRGGRTQDVIINVYDEDGVLVGSRNGNLSGGGSIHIVTDQMLNGKKGIATVQAELSESVIATAMHYGRTETLGIKYMYGIAGKQPLGSVLRGSYNTFLDQTCKLLLVNPTGSSVEVDVGMTRFDGTQVLANNTLTVPARGLLDYDLCANEESNNYGVVTVQPKVKNTIIASVLRIGPNSDYRFPTPVRR